MNIGIVGLGLIGGSIAKAIKKNTGHVVLGLDISEAIVYKAKLLESIDNDLPVSSLNTCDIVIIALYPGAAISFIEDNGDRFKKGSIVIDCCGVKENICESAFAAAKRYGFTFLGGHPMAGIEFSGFEHSKTSLFSNAPMILTPGPGTLIEVLDTVKHFFIAIGFAKVVISTPREHDKIIAYTSQLAHVVSSAYVKSDTALLHKGFSAGSYKDMTRVARLNEDMWCELFMANRENLTNEIDGIIERLEAYKKAIGEGNAGELTRLLREGRERKALAETV